MIKDSEPTQNPHSFGPKVAELYQRAQLLAEREKWHEALVLLETVASREPKNADYFEFKGDIQAKLKIWKPAAQSYLKAISLAPRSSQLFTKLGNLQMSSGDAKGAENSYKRSLELANDQNRAVRRYLLVGPDSDGLQNAYLELMKGCLTFLLWEASDGPLFEVSLKRPLLSFVRTFQYLNHRYRPHRKKFREMGKDWPAQALTMIGKNRLDNLQNCVECTLLDQVPGDFLEAGAWRGGAAIFMRALLKAYGDNDRKVWVADSFCGLPRPNIKEFPADKGYDLSVWQSLTVSAEEVRNNFRRFQLLDGQVEFLEGWFADTLPQAPISKLAVLRLDGDLYESTMDTLKSLYFKISPGGFVIVDDYYNAPPCQKAVDDFRKENAIQSKMIPADWSCAFWRKPF